MYPDRVVLRLRCDNGARTGTILPSPLNARPKCVPAPGMYEPLNAFCPARICPKHPCGCRIAAARPRDPCSRKLRGRTRRKLWAGGRRGQRLAKLDARAEGGAVVDSREAPPTWADSAVRDHDDRGGSTNPRKLAEHNSSLPLGFLCTTIHFDAHADNGRKLVRTIISSIGIGAIISPI